MSNRNTTFIPRRPRHEIVAEKGFSFEIARSDGRPHVQCSLQDLSRNGFKAWTDAAIPEGETVNVRIRLEQIGFDSPLPATIRWSEEEPEGGAMTGCLFHEPAPLELIGELILLGVIDSPGTP